MTTEKRRISHFDLDTFFVSVERLKNSRLIGKPVIVGGLSDRGVVSACSYETRKCGVHSGMPIKLAKSKCREAIVIGGDMDSYGSYSRMVTEIIAEGAPLFEKMSIDEHYLDLTGMDCFFDSKQWIHELRLKIIKETGLPISCGLSINKTVAKIATGQAKPCGELVVLPPNIGAFLAPLPIGKIPGVGRKTCQHLNRLGIFTVRSLQKIPVDMLRMEMGKHGVDLWNKANGVDFSPVRQYTERKSISTERTFSTDSNDTKRLNEILSGMVEKLTFELRESKKLTACIAVKVRFSDFSTNTLQRQIPYTSLDYEILEVVKELFSRLYNGKNLLRLIGVRNSKLTY